MAYQKFGHHDSSYVADTIEDLKEYKNLFFQFYKQYSKNEEFLKIIKDNNIEPGWIFIHFAIVNFNN